MTRLSGGTAGRLTSRETGFRGGFLGRTRGRLIAGLFGGAM